MKRKCNARSGLLLSLLVLAVFLLFPNKAAAVPVLTPKYPSVVFEGAALEGQQRRRHLRCGDQRGGSLVRHQCLCHLHRL